MSEKIRIKAYAKLNLALYVMPRRADGFHPIESVAVAVDVADKLTVKPTFDGTITTHYRNCAPVPFETDSARRAALLFFEARQNSAFSGAEISIEKNIRQMAGMGGSSTDAAATLAALGSLLGADPGLLSRVAANVGSDVTFLLEGGGAALMSGKGDDLQSVGKISGLYFVVVYCAEGLSTKAVFEEFDKTIRDPSQSALFEETAGSLSVEICAARKKTEALALALVRGDLASVERGLFNSLYDSARRLCPALARTAQIAEKVGVRLHLTGSGSAMFALFAGRQKSEEAADKLRQVGLDVTVCRTVPRGWEMF